MFYLSSLVIVILSSSVYAQEAPTAEQTADVVWGEVALPSVKEIINNMPIKQIKSIPQAPKYNTQVWGNQALDQLKEMKITSEQATYLEQFIAPQDRPYEEEVKSLLAQASEIIRKDAAYEVEAPFEDKSFFTLLHNGVTYHPTWGAFQQCTGPLFFEGMPDAHYPIAVIKNTEGAYLYKNAFNETIGEIENDPSQKEKDEPSYRIQLSNGLYANYKFTCVLKD